jgi:hypothetical protein
MGDLEALLLKEEVVPFMGVDLDIEFIWKRLGDSLG